MRSYHKMALFLFYQGGFSPLNLECLVTKSATPGVKFQSESEIFTFFQLPFFLSNRTRWLAHTRKCTKRGGPIFWIHENYVCPDCNLVTSAFFIETDMRNTHCVWRRNTSFKASIREGAEGYCCKDVPEGQFCNADRAGCKSLIQSVKYIEHWAGPNEPDTSEHNWSPHNEGCEKFRLISGADEIALNAEMGLYRLSFKPFPS